MLVIVSVVVWGLVLLIPGDPAVTLAGEGASPSTILALRHKMGLDRPVELQYFHWLGGALHGNLGSSLFSGVPVRTVIWERLPVTLSLTLCAIVMGLLIAVPLGALAALRAGGFTDRAVSALGAAGIALPSFWFGGLLIIAFALHLKLFPAGGYVPFSESPSGWLWHLALPAFALSVEVGAQLMRQLRAALVDVLDEGYIRTARSKGLKSRRILFRHAFRNAAGPMVTVLGLRIASLLGGAVVVEAVFGLPGIGSLLVQSAFSHDLVMVQGITIMFAVIVLSMNLIVDVCYGWLNPRIQLYG